MRQFRISVLILPLLTGGIILSSLPAGPALAQSMDALGPSSYTLVRKLVAQAESEAPQIRKMVRAKNAQEFGQCRATSSILGKFLSAAKAFELGVPDRELQVLRSLPKSAEEMEAFYEFVYEKGNEDLGALYRPFYEEAFRSVVKHPEYLPAVILLPGRFDADDIDWSCEQLIAVHRAIPDAYETAVKQESGPDRDFLTHCGGRLRA